MAAWDEVYNNITRMTRDDLESLVVEIVALLYDVGNKLDKDKEWSADELPEIASILANYNVLPVAWNQ